jgi:exodeoxyribonuclease-3
MKIISWNVNGIRSIYKKNFLNWFLKNKADIFCLQEIKAQKEQIPSDLLYQKDYYFYFNQAVKKGYAGVAVYTKQKPLKVKDRLGLDRFDKEGRILELEYSNFTLINLYMPHGGRQKENLSYKLEVYNYLLRYLKNIRKRNKNIILIGDFNIAHQDIDLARPKQNQNNIMFTPKERQQIDKIINLGFIDTFRKFHKEGGYYTWWPYMAKARERNLGWRIDYVFISKELAQWLKDAFIFSEITGSDHCPIGIEINSKIWH